MKENNHHEFTYEKEGATTMVLFVHGFVGSPNQFETLAKGMYHRGYSVCGILLPGHGGHNQSFINSTADSWENHVNAATEKWSKTYENIVLVGHSMGGLLSLNISLKHSCVKGVVLIATPLILSPTLRGIVNCVKIGALSEKWDSPVNKAYRRANSIEMEHLLSYPQWLIPLCEFFKVMNRTKRILCAVTVPVLILQSKQDETVSPKSADKIKNKLKGKTRTVMLKKSWHSYFTPQDKTSMMKEVGRFLEKVVTNPKK